MKITNLPGFGILLSVLLYIQGCNQQDISCIPSPDISGIELHVEIDRLDQKLKNAGDKETMGRILRQNPVFAEVFLSRSQYPNEEIFTENIFQLFQNPHIDTLFQETEEIFKDFEDVRLQFEEAFKRIQYYYPEYIPPRIQTVVSGLSSDMYLSDSLIIIGLDYYLGEGAKFRPINTPLYILERYRKENIVPNSLLLISTRFNNSDPRQNSLLAEMIYYGKAHYFSKQMLPCVPDSIFFGYTTEEMKDIYYNQPIIWASLIQNESLFETSHIIKDKFIGERPKTYEISERCPGRIGRWLGWEIVKSYAGQMEEPDLVTIMGIADANLMFEQSRFKPKSLDY